jgi:CBS domain-containing protein
MMTADVSDELRDEEAYFDSPGERSSRVFDARLLRAPLDVLPIQKPLVFAPESTVTEAMRAMQASHRGCVVVTTDGTPRTRLIGIFTERDVLFRIVDRGRNPATLPIGEAMTSDPEFLTIDSSIAHVLNKMSVGGFRHVPVVDSQHHPVCVISVRDVVAFLVASFPREVLNLSAGGEGQREREGA